MGTHDTEPVFLLEVTDIKFLRDLGIDPEVPEHSIDDEFNDVFEHIKQIRIRRGEWT
jgi:hypothetical protein